MKQNNIQGRIVNLSSIRATRIMTDNYSYDLSKAAVDHLTKSMAVDLARYKVYFIFKKF